jgi:hypothetical protein
MLRRALDNRYDGPVEGLTAIMELGVEYGAYMLNGPLIGLLLAGSVIVGVISEWVAHRWS